jgi:hypothetical protein
LHKVFSLYQISRDRAADYLAASFGIQVLRRGNFHSAAADVKADIYHNIGIVGVNLLDQVFAVFD